MARSALLQSERDAPAMKLLRERPKMSGDMIGFEPLKLIRVESFCSRYIGFTRVTDSAGRQGWGQLSTYHSDLSAEVMHRQVAPYILGQTFTDWDGLSDKVFEREHKFPGSYLKRALGGIDTALWDLRGKILGLPVCSLIGGSPGPLRCYASSMRRDITPEDEALRFLRLRDAHGFDAFKFRIGAEYGHDQDEWHGRTEAIIPAIRKALGPEAALLVDANSAFSPQRAIAVAAILLDQGIEHFEEPCLYWELDQTRAVREALADQPIAVTGGEQDCEFPVWRQMIRERVVDVVQPDILYLGGLSRSLRVCEMAAKAGLPVTPHAANQGLVTLFTMHLLRALGGPVAGSKGLAGKYLEFSIEGADYYPWQYGLYREDPYRVEAGEVEVSDAPGWGVEICPEWLAKSTYKVSEAA